MAEIPYQVETPDDWVATVDSWRWEAVTGDHDKTIGWDKRGNCPRCAHPMGVSIGIVSGVRAFETDVPCNCATTHTDGKSGCGAHGRIAGPS